MTRRFVDYLLRNLQGMVDVERSFEDVKDIADNIAVVAALLLPIPVTAATHYSNFDWDVFKEMTLSCGEEYSDHTYLFSYDQILLRMKNTTVAASCCQLMILIGVAMLHICLIGSTVEKYRRPINVFIFYLSLLLTVSVFCSVWIFEFYVDFFMQDSTDFCESKIYFGRYEWVYTTVPS